MDAIEKNKLKAAVDKAFADAGLIGESMLNTYYMDIKNFPLSGRIIYTIIPKKQA